MTIKSGSDEIPGRHVHTYIRYRQVNQDSPNDNGRDRSSHPYSLANLTLALPLAKLIIRNADDTGDKLKERITFPVLAFPRVRRDWLGRFVRQVAAVINADQDRFRKTFQEAGVRRGIRFPVDDQAEDAGLA